MSRYADVDKTLESLDCLFKKSNVKCLDLMRVGYNHAVADSIAAVKEQPIVEVVRCKDCKYYYDEEKWCSRLALCKEFDGNGFCSHGERKE